MLGLERIDIDYAPLWTGFLLFCRFSAMLVSLPGIGARMAPETVYVFIAIGMATAYTMVAPPAADPQNLGIGFLMIASELLLGYLIGAIPLFITSSLAVAGQITSASIGLGQANLIDPSLGESVAILARLQLLIGTLLFLIIDGHHAIIRAASGLLVEIPVGVFSPNGDVAAILVSQFGSAFQLAITITAPILVTVLLTQFIFGLLTKFVPQVNIFIISLPLTIGLGLYIIQFTFPGMTSNLFKHFSEMEEVAGRIMVAGDPKPAQNQPTAQTP